jgi:hypothetical protein
LVGHIITVQVTAVQIIAALVITKHLGFLLKCPQMKPLQNMMVPVLRRDRMNAEAPSGWGVLLRSAVP